MSIKKNNIASEARNEQTAIDKMRMMVGTIHIVRKRPAKRPGGRVNRRPNIWGNPLKGHELEPINAHIMSKKERAADEVRASIALLSS